MTGIMKKDEIELQEVFMILRKWRTLILMIVIISSLLTYMVNIFILKPVYASSTQLIVNNKQPSQNGMLTNADLQMSLNLIETYKEVLISPRILDKVIKDYNLSYTILELQKKISVRTVKQSQVISITVEDRSPEKAALIANAVAATFQKEIPLIMSVDNVQILAEAYPNLKPVKPRILINVLLITLVSLLLSIVAVFVIEFLDQTFKNEQDVEATLNIPVLGVIGIIQYDKHKTRHRSMTDSQGVNLSSKHLDMPVSKEEKKVGI